LQWDNRCHNGTIIISKWCTLSQCGIICHNVIIYIVTMWRTLSHCDISYVIVALSPCLNVMLNATLSHWNVNDEMLQCTCCLHAFTCFSWLSHRWGVLMAILQMIGLGSSFDVLSVEELGFSPWDAHDQSSSDVLNMW